MPISKMFMSILKRLPKSKTSAVLKDKEKLRRMAKDLDDYSKGPNPGGYRDVDSGRPGRERGHAQGMRDHRRKRALESTVHNIEDQAKKVRDLKKKYTQEIKDREAFVKKEEKKYSDYLDKRRKERWGEDKE